MRVVALRKNRFKKVKYGGWANQIHKKFKNKVSKSSNFLSKGERNLRKVCKLIFSKNTILYNDRTKLNGLELDVYIPDLKLAFEFNGLQHYQFVSDFHKSKDDFYSQKRRDIIKYNLCKCNGIHLLVLTNPDEMDITFKMFRFMSQLKLTTNQSNKIIIGSSP